METTVERDNEMIRLYRAGWTLNEVGEAYGVSRERVRQILKRRGFTGEDGGIQKRRADREARRQEKIRAKRDAQTREIYGCSEDEFQRVQKRKTRFTGPARSYIEQRKNALQRGIEWNLSFPDWYRIWDGRLHLKGRGADALGLTRIDFDRPFEPGNVVVLTNKETSVHYQRWLRGKA